MQCPIDRMPEDFLLGGARADLPWGVLKSAA